MSTQHSRVKIKRSTVTTEVPTVAPSTDHLDGTWDALDIYIGEIFINTADDKVWTRTDAGILQIFPASGGTDLDGTQIDQRITRGNGVNTVESSLWFINDTGVMYPNTDGLDIGITGTNRVGQSWMQELRVEATGSSGATVVAQLEDSGASVLFEVLGDGEVNTRDGISQNGLNLIQTTSLNQGGTANSNVLAGELAGGNKEGDTAWSINVGYKSGYNKKNQQSVLLGAYSDCVDTGNSMIAIGYNATCNNSESIALGRDSTTTASKQIVFGDPTYRYTHFYFGEGVTNSNGSNITFSLTNGTGTDQNTGDWIHQTGATTGAGVSGVHLFKVSPVAGSGSGANAPATVFEIGDAKIGFHGVTAVARGAALTATDGTLARAITRIAELEAWLVNIGIGQ